MVSLLQERREQPVIIYTFPDDQVEIKHAAHLWGEDTYHVQELIKGELDEPGVRVSGDWPCR